MATSELGSSDAIKQWLDTWRQSLTACLECGVATLTPQARQRLQRWARQSADAGWREVAGLAEVVLDSGTSESEKADALLDLLTWLECTERLFELQRLLPE